MRQNAAAVEAFTVEESQGAIKGKPARYAELVKLRTDASKKARDQAEVEEQARKVRKQAFGFSLPSIALFEKGEDKEEVANFDGVVSAARQNSAGAWVIPRKPRSTAPPSRWRKTRRSGVT